MADWYVSSVAYSGVSAFVASASYTVGQLVKPTAPAAGREYVFRCTTAGAASTEPTWPIANNATVTTGGATFTNVSAQSAYGWGAAAGSLYAIAAANSNRPLVGDRVFLSSDHSENFSLAGNQIYGFNNSAPAFGLIEIVSVNRGGSVPPVEADIIKGAAITASPTNISHLIMDAYCGMFWQGITFTHAGTNASLGILFTLSGTKAQYFKNCAIAFTGSNTSKRIGNASGNTAAKVVFDNTTVQFGNVSDYIGASSSSLDLTWLNTSAAIQGSTLPSALFTAAGAGSNLITCRGVDLSAVTGILLSCPNANVSSKVLLDSCRINAAVTRLSINGNLPTEAQDEIELINCFDGTNTLTERHTVAGDSFIDRAIYLNGGALDDASSYSLKLVTGTRSDFCVLSLDSFAFDVENALTGSSKTATVEVVSSPGLNNNDLKLLLEYMGTSGNQIASFADSLASVLTPASALPPSSNAWTGPAGSSWNPLDITSNITLSNSNLTATASASGGVGFRALTGFSSGKYYFELTATVLGPAFMLAPLSTALGTNVNQPGSVGVATSTGGIFVNGAIQSGGLGGRANGDIIGFAVDLAAQLFWCRVAPSGNWNGSSTANPATGAGGFSTSVLGLPLFPYVGVNATVTGAVTTANFGASAFSGAVPSGYVAGWPGTPQNRQLLQVGFTPQRSGRVRGLVRLGKPSSTVWVNPQIAIS